MHEGQVPIDTMLVADMLRAQFPQYADLPLQAVRSGGTENAVFRLGADLALRMPLHAGSVSSLLKEARWSRVVAPLFTLQTPSVVATGHPGSGYPFPWAIVSWLDGVDGQQSDIGGSHRAVAALAADIRSLWSTEQDVPSASTLGASRGGPIEIRDNDFRVALSQCSGLTDIARIAAIWDEALAAPAWDGASVWLHTDLLPSNLLVRDGALVGVLDFGAMATGDPAYDVTPAWMVFDGPSRATYLQELSVQVGDPMWLRARGLAVPQASSHCRTTCTQIRAWSRWRSAAFRRRCPSNTHPERRPSDQRVEMSGLEGQDTIQLSKADISVHAHRLPADIGDAWLGRLCNGHRPIATYSICGALKPAPRRRINVSVDDSRSMALTWTKTTVAAPVGGAAYNI